MDKLVELFYYVDDFYRAFIPQWEQICLENGHRQGRMGISEIMTILILLHNVRLPELQNILTRDS